ncbi:hypothetical protein NC652_024790 [Populus alba x Populus x berolinensis]|nr:hypothetical protein NC652_024790 [Populus alba x Populus x berolinensis]
MTVIITVTEPRIAPHILLSTGYSTVTSATAAHQHQQGLNISNYTLQLLSPANTAQRHLLTDRPPTAVTEVVLPSHISSKASSSLVQQHQLAPVVAQPLAEQRASPLSSNASRQLLLHKQAINLRPYNFFSPPSLMGVVHENTWRIN